MDKIHPTTRILWGLLMISIATHWVQWSHIKKLEKEVAPVIVRPQIRTFELAPEERII